MLIATAAEKPATGCPRRYMAETLRRQPHQYPRSHQTVALSWNLRPRRAGGLTVGRCKLERSRMPDFHFLATGYSPNQLLRTRIILETGILPYVMQAMMKDPELFAAVHVERAPGSRTIPTFTSKRYSLSQRTVKAAGIAPIAFLEQLLLCFFKSLQTGGDGAAARTGNAAFIFIAASHRVAAIAN